MEPIDLIQGSSKTRRVRIGLAVSGAGLLAIVILTGTDTRNRHSSSPSAATVGAAKEGFAQAMTAERKMLVPSGPASLGTALSASDLTSIDTAGRHLVASYFVGDEAALARKHLQLVVQSAQSPDQQELDSGVSNIEYMSVTSSRGGSMTVHALVSVWSKQAARQPGGPWTIFTPTAVQDTRVTMVQQNGRWLVSSEQWQFVDGTGP